MSDEKDDSLPGTEHDEHQGGNADDSSTTGTGDERAQGGNDEPDEIAELREKAARAEKLEQEKQQWLAEKGNYEQLRRSQSSQVVDPDAEAHKAAQERYRALHAAAEQGDPYAGAILDQARINMEMRRERMVDKQLAAIPENKRDEVRRLYEGGGFESPTKIWDVMKPAYDEAQKVATTRARRDDDAAAHNARRADTSTRTLGAAETKQKRMTFDEYEQLQDDAERDPSKRAAADQAYRDKEAGALRLVTRR